MAADRAKTMQRMTRINLRIESSKLKGKFIFVYSGGTITVLEPGMAENQSSLIEWIAKKNPITAKGIAKMVWENLMRLR
jgi:hypothetical protein